jgi:peptidoglycan/LPS O-acetylase OafA/YrhL
MVQTDSGARPVKSQTREAALSTTAAARHENCFDFLRLFAAVCVMFAHAAEHLKVPFGWLNPAAPQSVGNRVWFYDGVPLFFILSGFLVYHSYARSVERGRPLRQYVTNRFLRVAPAIYVYAVVVALWVLVAGAAVLEGAGKIRFGGWLASHFVLYPITSAKLFPFFNGGTPNGSLWTIPVEFSFYLAVPLLFQVERRLGSRGMLVVLAAGTLATLVLIRQLLVTQPSSRFTQLLMTCFMPYLMFFGLGVFWSKAWGRVAHGAGVAAICALVYIVVRVADVFGWRPSGLAPGASLAEQLVMGPWYGMLWSVALSYVVLWVGHYGPRQLSIFTHRIGDWSYGIYIWHMVVVNFALWVGLPQVMSSIIGGIQLFVIVVTCLLAALSWRWVEKPALSFKPYTSRSAVNDETTVAVRS